MKGVTSLRAGLFCLIMAFIPLVHAQSMPAETVAAETQRVNVNQADAATIARVLNGIGMSRAEAIVAWREENGAFKSVQDLMKVRGVGEATIQRNLEKIVFE